MDLMDLLSLLWTVVRFNTYYIPGFYGHLVKSLDSYTLPELNAFHRTYS
jgi:hypothetical protein